MWSFIQYSNVRYQERHHSLYLCWFVLPPIPAFLALEIDEKADMADTLTVEFCKKPGEAFLRKMLL